MADATPETPEPRQHLSQRFWLCAGIAGWCVGLAASQSPQMPHVGLIIAGIALGAMVTGIAYEGWIANGE